MQLVKLEDIPRQTFDPLKNMDVVEIYKICNRMENVCLAENGIGLSAVQVGLPYNLFIIQRGNTFEHYLNCTYEPSGDLTTSIEGCLSIKNDSGAIRRFKLQRHTNVLVKGQKLSFSDNISVEDVEFLESGFYAVVFQHEIDHSFGVFISDKGEEIQVL